MDHFSYQARSFDLSGLNGISDQTLETHFKLYEGYVRASNELTERIAEFLEKREVDQEKILAYSELKRRLGFEFNGMVLHEFYFENLTKQGGADPDSSSLFVAKAKSSFGSYEKWKSDFVGVGKMRGVGWAICYADPRHSSLTNHWISLHEIGNIASFQPILVMDVWEHAYLLDYKPAERGKYIEAFFSNVDWSVIDGRIAAMEKETQGAEGKAASTKG